MTVARLAVYVIMMFHRETVCVVGFYPGCSAGSTVNLGVVQYVHGGLRGVSMEVRLNGVGVNVNACLLAVAGERWLRLSWKQLWHRPLRTHWLAS